MGGGKFSSCQKMIFCLVKSFNRNVLPNPASHTETTPKVLPDMGKTPSHCSLFRVLLFNQIYNCSPMKLTLNLMMHWRKKLFSA